MFQKNNLIRWILLGLAIIISFGVIFVVRSRQAIKDVVYESTPTLDNDFSEQNFNKLNVDSFISVVTKAYAPNVTTSINNDELIVKLENANQLTKDFFNGNDAILEVPLRKFGFNIDYDANTQKVMATFTIKNNMVNVPNDVLIKIADKLYN